jgi:hypothetical protein
VTTGARLGNTGHSQTGHGEEAPGGHRVIVKQGSGGRAMLVT